ncbi:hypothetical protein chiPu_0029363, partial [Chiloscyllium punctatum]|nr:hypothetical protein [Chiloscyllium punctatum]
MHARGRSPARIVAAARPVSRRGDGVPGRQRHHDCGGDVARPACADGRVQTQPAVAG